MCHAFFSAALLLGYFLGCNVAVQRNEKLNIVTAESTRKKLGLPDNNGPFGKCNENKSKVLALNEKKKNCQRIMKWIFLASFLTTSIYDGCNLRSSLQFLFC